VTCDPALTVSINAGTGDATISWSSQTGKTYTVKSKTDLTATWGDEETGIAGTGGTISRTYPSGLGNKFYSIICN